MILFPVSPQDEKRSPLRSLFYLYEEKLIGLSQSAPINKAENLHIS